MNEKCRWVINPGERHKQICGDPAVQNVTIGSVTGEARVPVCPQHLAEHNRKAAQKRTAKR